MAILLTGGTGKTSSRTARLLLDAKIPFLITSRKGPLGAPAGMQVVKFDWHDPSTFESPFEHKFPNGENISAVYLVAPQSENPVSSMVPFIDIARKNGVRRFVLLTGNSIAKGGLGIGQVWKHLADSEADVCVLRATWFMDNFLLWQHGASIKNEGRIYSACGDGKVSFISTNSIAAVAFRTLTDTQPHNTDYSTLGPELLTFDDIAVKLSSGIGKEIKHVKISEDESIRRFENFGIPERSAKFLAGIETATANGEQELTGGDVERVIGQAPQSFDEWVQENKTGFQE